jgi:branched-chain amino acid transport system ATP-binding protein
MSAFATTTTTMTTSPGRDVPTQNAMLELRDVQTFYGHIHALKGITLEVRVGEIVTLIGANGAGKSTTLKTISGLLSPKSGEILFEGKRINGMPAHKVAATGIAQSPEGRRVFPRMSVLENLEMGAYVHGKVDSADLERVMDLFPRLKERIGQKAGTLSGGEQQMLAIGRALMAKPRLLLLDEPSMGLAPILVEQIFDIVVEVNKQGTPVLLVEQNALMALAISHRGYVIQTGEIVLTDDSQALLRNDLVRKAYLGED